MMHIKEISWQDLLTRLEFELEKRLQDPGHAEADHQAWEESYNRIRHYSEAVLRTRADVEENDLDDIVQEMLLKLQNVEMIRRLRLSRSPVGYLIVTIRNVANDRARHRRMERDSLARLGLELFSVTVGESNENRDESIDTLNRYFRLLKHDEKSLLKLRFWNNLSMGQIAEKLGLPYSTVAVRMFRLLKRLRDSVSHELKP